MGEVVITVAKWALKIAFFSAVILALIVIFGLITSYMVVGFNQSVLGDIFGIIQIWLPFNLNILLIWLALSATAYFAYRLATMAYNLLNSWIGK